MKKQKTEAFGKDVYLLGKEKQGDYCWLESASFDCNWYWGFGYVETYTNNKNPNKAKDINSHRHYDTLILKKGVTPKEFCEFFEETPLNDSEIWKLNELMKTFYILKEASAVFHIGGSHLTSNPLKESLKNDDLNNHINKVILPELFEEVYKILKP